MTVYKPGIKHFEEIQKKLLDEGNEWIFSGKKIIPIKEVVKTLHIKDLQSIDNTLAIVVNDIDKKDQSFLKKMYFCVNLY